jgi:hypothetical protein
VHADGLPEILYLFKGGWVRFRRRGGDADGAIEQVSLRVLDATLFAPGHRVTTDEVNASWDSALSYRDNAPFGAADVGDEGTGLQRWADLGKKVREDTHRSAEDGQVGVSNGLGGVFECLIDCPYPHRLVQRRAAVSVTYDFATSYSQLHRQPKGPPQQPHPQNR